MKKKFLIVMLTLTLAAVVMATGCSSLYANDDQVVGLQNQVNSLSSQINSTQQQLAATQQQLDSTQQSLSQAQSQLQQQNMYVTSAQPVQPTIIYRTPAYAIPRHQSPWPSRPQQPLQPSPSPYPHL